MVHWKNSVSGMIILKRRGEFEHSTAAFSEKYPEVERI